VTLVGTDVSEERIGSIIRVESWCFSHRVEVPRYCYRCSSFPDTTLMLEATCSSETSVLERVICFGVNVIPTSNVCAESVENQFNLLSSSVAYRMPKLSHSYISRTIKVR
jgi:hypothetical protein